MAEKKNKPEIRFKGFVEEWEESKLGDVATMKARIGWQGLTQKEFLKEGDYYLITGTDFENGLIDFKNCYYISENRYIQDVNIQVKNDDVLITKDGTIGKVAYVQDMDKPTTLNAGVFVIRGEDKKISNLYLYQYLAAPFLLDYAYKQATGGTIKHLNQNVLVKFPFPFPNIKEQTQLGLFFKHLDHLITLHQRKYDKLVTVKNAMLEKMFPQNGAVDPEIRFKGFTEDWEDRKLDSIFNKIRNAFVGTSSPYYVNEGHFYLESNNVKDGQINRKSEIFINDEFYEKQKDNLLHTGDLVMVQSGHVGHSAVIPPELNNIAAHALIILAEPRENICSYFLNFQFQTTQIKKEIGNITTGNTIKHILSSEMKKFIVSFPEYDEQKKIGSFFTNLDNLITLQQRELEKLKNIKKACLEKMFV